MPNSIARARSVKSDQGRVHFGRRMKRRGVHVEQAAHVGEQLRLHAQISVGAAARSRCHTLGYFLLDQKKRLVIAASPGPVHGSESQSRCSKGDCPPLPPDPLIQVRLEDIGVNHLDAVREFLLQATAR